MKRSITVILTSVLLAMTSFTPSAVSETIPDEQLLRPLPPVENGNGYSGVYYDDQSTLQRAFYFLESGPMGPARLNTFITCKSALEEPCKSDDVVSFETPLSPCSATRQRDCVVSLEAILSNGSYVKGQALETVTAASEVFGTGDLRARYFTPFTGDPNRGIPDSGYASLWQFPGISHQGGDKFLLVPKLNTNQIDLKGTQPVNLDVGIFPVSVISEKREDCFFTTPTSCLQRWPFPKEIGYRLTLRTGSKLIGWFYGRLTSPNIKSERVSDGQTEISVEGKPVTVPIVAAWSKNEELPKRLDALIESEFIARGGQFGGVCFYSGCATKDRSQQVVMDERNPSFKVGSDYFERYLLWLEVAKDKAYANKSTWSFRSLEEYAQYEKCIGDSGVAGLVTTNSNAYIATPPIFENDELTYKVASPHFDSRGEVQIGSYDLAIRSDIARCIYGFTSAPVSATLSVLYENGETVKATQSVGERGGWLYLSAKGFTYSAPTLRVKVTQQVASVSPTRKTISCVKGVKLKKVTAVKPTCPKGYKKA